MGTIIPESVRFRAQWLADLEDHDRRAIERVVMEHKAVIERGLILLSSISITMTGCAFRFYSPACQCPFWRSISHVL